MTEAEYRTLDGSDRLPLYDVDDSRCEQIDQPRDPAYDTVREATSLADAQDCVANPSLEFRGGIRYSADSGDMFVYAYFWKKR